MQPEESLEKSGYGKEICKREVAEKREEDKGEERRTVRRHTETADSAQSLRVDGSSIEESREKNKTDQKIRTTDHS